MTGRYQVESLALGVPLEEVRLVEVLLVEVLEVVHVEVVEPQQVAFAVLVTQHTEVQQAHIDLEVVQCSVVVACLLEVRMAVNQGQEHNGSMAAQQLLEAGMVMLRAVMVLAVEGQSH